MFNCVINPRVSSKEQQETGYSLPAQEKLLKDYCLRTELNIVKVFSVSETASRRKERKNFKEMLAYMKEQRIKILVMEKVDRLTRNMKDAVMINDWLEADPERQVHFVKDTLVLHKNSRSQERLNWNIKVVLAQNYIENLSEEVKKGQKEKLDQGWLPTTPPPGYLTIGEKGRKIHVIDKQQSPLIKEMFELYANGTYTIESLVSVMWKKGLRSRRGKRIGKSRMSEHLSDPFFIGKNVWDGKTSPGAQETFITRDLFNRVQKVKNRGVHKYKKHSYLFRGLITCEDCGGILSWETQKGNRYGRCNSYRNCIKRPYYKESELIALVSAEFNKFKLEDQRLLEYVRHAILDDHAQKVASRKSTLARFEQQLNRVNQRLHRIYLDRLDDRIPVDQYDRLFKEFNEEKEEIITTQKDFLTNSDNYQEIGVVVYDLAQKAKESFIEADIEKQRKIMKLLFTKMSIVDGKLNLELDLAFQILSKAVQESKSSKMAHFEKVESEIFEPSKNPYSSTQKAPFGAYCPTLLAAWAKFRTYAWLASSKLLVQSNYKEACILLDQIKQDTTL